VEIEEKKNFIENTQDDERKNEKKFIAF